MKVLIIGSGPIVIGQACEFDYSGTQACKALRQCGHEVVLVNSNPATVMTDPDMADATYIEPLTVKSLEQIIAKEKPDALLPNLGGQTGLNLATKLEEEGVLHHYGVKVIGVDLAAIKRGEDRQVFKNTMSMLGIKTPASGTVNDIESAKRLAAKIGYPVVVRPAYTMGGAGSGFCDNEEELVEVCRKGLAASLTTQCLIEKSIKGWEELEVEVVRDAKNQMVAVCFIENIDPVGVHTGDSCCVAPFQTVSKALQDKLQDMAFRIVEKIGVIGGTNVQFAYDPKTGEVNIIEINPRTSRSSALASKATGFPIALVSAKLAAGMTLDQLPYWNGKSLADYRPTGDYVVIKFAKWAFEKFKGSKDELGTQMKAVGEVMSIGKNLKEAFQKAIRSLEKRGCAGLGNVCEEYDNSSLETLLDMLKTPSSDRYFQLYAALKKGATDEQVFALTGVKAFYVQQLRELVQQEAEWTTLAEMTAEKMQKAKENGFSDKYLAVRLGCSEADIRKKRAEFGCKEVWQKVPVSGCFEPKDYFYSTYAKCKDHREKDSTKKVMILGGGPNRIGQGIEFDYCCTHAALALQKLGYKTIIVNCNPETVSTDYDTADTLYFEPVTVEDVLQIYEAEKPEGIIVQFGGQTPLNVAKQLEEAGCKILGTSVASIDAAEDRDAFHYAMTELDIPMPESMTATDSDSAKWVAKELGYPLIIRPSFVLGGRGMEVVYDDKQLEDYVQKAIGVTPDTPLYLDRFLHHALECEADALADKHGNVFVPAVMEHVELAGIHSGDSACRMPAENLTVEQQKTIKDYAAKIAKHLNVVGLMNMQFAIEDEKVYVIEANPRASRTVPFVSKVAGVQMADIAAELMVTDKSLAKDFSLLNSDYKIPYVGVKEAVLPFDKFPEVDPVLGPEMRSTGEVLAIAPKFGEAYAKSQEAAGYKLPYYGTCLVSLADKTAESIEVIKRLSDWGFSIMATKGTADFLLKNGIRRVSVVNKVSDGTPNVVDAIAAHKVQLIINVPAADKADVIDHHSIRTAAIKHHVAYLTTLQAAKAATDGICQGANFPIKSLQQWHQMLYEHTIA